MKPLTYVALLLDKSGSMKTTKNAAIVGFNEQIQQFKENAKNDQDIRISLITFNGEVTEHTWGQPAEEMVEITENDYNPAGATSMLDAMGYTIQKLMETTSNQDAAYLVIVISDGATNSDKHFNSEKIRSLVQDCQGSGKWTFSYVGCTSKVIEEVSKSTGIPLSNMAQWTSGNDEGVSLGLAATKDRSKQYFTKRSMGSYSDLNYMSDTVGCSANFTSDGVKMDDMLKKMKLNKTSVK